MASASRASRTASGAMAVSAADDMVGRPLEPRAGAGSGGAGDRRHCARRLLSSPIGPPPVGRGTVTCATLGGDLPRMSPAPGEPVLKQSACPVGAISGDISGDIGDVSVLDDAARPGSLGPVGAVDPAEAEEFLRLVHAENPARGRWTGGWRAYGGEIDRTGTYRHTADELQYGARLAWRNRRAASAGSTGAACVVRDLREVSDAAGGSPTQCVEHLRDATNGGKIRPVVTVFAPAAPDGAAPRIWNEQLIRYAGYRAAGRRSVRRGPALRSARPSWSALGWPGGAGTPSTCCRSSSRPTGRPAVVPSCPPTPSSRSRSTHPELAWFADLGLRWHAVPAISQHAAWRSAGSSYPAAPFNGWYMGTEIGARNLADADRYDLLPVVAERMGLDTSTSRTLWRDRALVELNRRRTALVRRGRRDRHRPPHRVRSVPDPPREGGGGRPHLPGRLAWIVPPISGARSPPSSTGTTSRPTCGPGSVPAPPYAPPGRPSPPPSRTDQPLCGPHPTPPPPPPRSGPAAGREMPQLAGPLRRVTGRVSALPAKRDGREGRCRVRPGGSRVLRCTKPFRSPDSTGRVTPAASLPEPST